MANRVTPEEVKAIMGDCDAELSAIEPFIDTAHLYIDTVFTGVSITNDLLKELEKWLSAHFVSVTICRFTSREEIGDVVITYAGKWEQGLTMTSYGQMVLQLDVTGQIEKQKKQKASVYAVKSFTK